MPALVSCAWPRIAKLSHRAALALQKTTVPGYTAFPLASTLALSVTGLPTLTEAEGKRVNVVDVVVLAFATSESDRPIIRTRAEERRWARKSRLKDIAPSWHTTVHHMLTKDKI